MTFEIKKNVSAGPDVFFDLSGTYVDVSNPLNVFTIDQFKVTKKIKMEFSIISQLKYKAAPIQGILVQFTLA